MAKKNKEQVKQEKAEFLNRLIEILSDNRKSSDKAFLTLSTASFGFSIIILRLFDKNYPTTLSFDFIFCAWWAFGITIILTLFSFHASEKHIKHSYDYIDSDYQSKKHYRSAKKWGKVTSAVNLISLTSITLGIIMFLLFATFNIGKPMKDTEDKYIISQKNSYTRPIQGEVVEKSFTLPNSALQKPIPSQSEKGSDGD